MKYNILFLMLISLFSISPSYAQTERTQKSGVQNEDPGFTLEPVTNNHADQVGFNQQKKAESKQSADDILEQQEKEKAKWKEEEQELTSKIDNLRSQLNHLYADNFMQKWGDVPFSEFKNSSFQTEILDIKDALHETPKPIQQLAEDYQAYQEGIKCVASKYDKQAIDSVMGKIKAIREQLPKTADNKKKEDLKNLHMKLFDYRNAVELFQDLIKTVTATLASKKLTIKEVFSPKSEYVDPDVEGLINSYDWLRVKYQDFKKELANGGNDVQNEILNLLESPAQP